MITVGIRDLKARATEFINRAAAGESIVVARRGRPVAMLEPLPAGARAIEEMRRSGRVRWAGGKPAGIPVSDGKKAGKANADVSGAVVEGRRR